jgi:hypothetical protein
VSWLRLRRYWPALQRVAAAALVIAAFGISARNVAHGQFAMGDFKAFYCSGYVLVHGGDPYMAAPLARCEAMPEPKPLFFTKHSQVLPAPLPGYAIAAFVPFSFLPFTVASTLWLALLAAATLAALELFGRIGVASREFLAVALALILIAVCFPVGELPPIALFGIALAAWAGRERKPWFVALGVALTFFEPQIGLAMLVASVAIGRRFAIPALCAALVLGLVSLASVGIAGNLEYLRVVLPAHLISELPSALQYSLSSILYRIGVTPNAAILAGRLSWLFMLGVVFWFARSSDVKSRPEVAFLAAPAFAVVGGPFLHLDHIALAVPAALWIATSTGAPSWVRIGIAAALSLPILYIFSILQLAVLAPFIAAWIGWAVSRRPIVGLRTAGAAIGLMLVFGVLAAVVGTGSMQTSPVAPIPADIAQASWARYIAQQHVMTSWTVLVVKAPIWIGVIATATALLGLARGNLKFAH